MSNPSVVRKRGRRIAGSWGPPRKELKREANRGTRREAMREDPFLEKTICSECRMSTTRPTADGSCPFCGKPA